MTTARAGERTMELALVLGLHALALGALWQHRLIPLQDEVATLFVSIVEPTPRPPEAARPARVEKARPIVPEPARQLVAQAPVVLAAEPVAPPLPPAPAVDAAPAPAPKPAGPVALGTELAVSCPERTPPRYPPLSRRLNEEGKVVLRVELDEEGAVAAASVAQGSGHVRLDEAALAAVKGWRCKPARRDGRPLRAVALQPFKFVLEGN